MMENGEQFLQVDTNIYNNIDGNRIIIFGTTDGLQFLTNCDDWFMDGTFDVAPPQFAQLYTVHGLRADHHIIGCYALLRHKNRETYVRLLEEVLRLTNGVSPETVMIDFEQACIAALAVVFPDTLVYGCLFHLSQSVFRNVQVHGLQEEYLNNGEFRMNIRMMISLAFVPRDDVIQSFEALSEHCIGNEQVILDYFETNYIGEFRRGRRRDPLFPHVLWNIHRRVIDDLPRTTNMLEGWHKQFATSVSCAHPTIWKFVKVLRKDAGVQLVRIAHFVAGRPPTQQKRVYRDLNERVKTIVNDYGNRNIIEFLRGIQYNLTE